MVGKKGQITEGEEPLLKGVDAVLITVTTRRRHPAERVESTHVGERGTSSGWVERRSKEKRSGCLQKSSAISKRVTDHEENQTIKRRNGSVDCKGGPGKNKDVRRS